MEHTPYGYDIIGGRAAVNEEQAADIRRICENYLSGMSFIKAAEDVGLAMSHCGVKRMIQNPRYLGDDFYPAILTKETTDKVEKERIRREKALGRDRRKGKGAPEGTVYAAFSSPKIPLKYDDPIKQAEYVSPVGEQGYAPQITSIQPTLDRHVYHVRDYVGRNAASFGKDKNSNRIDEYGHGEIRFVFTSESGTYVDSGDINDLKKYIVVGQDMETGDG